MTTEVVVVGAGVLGLTTAYQLSRDTRYKVTVISKCLPTDPHTDYTSQYAGANWRSVCSNKDYKMIAIEEATLHYFRKFSETHPDLVNKCMSYDVLDPRDSIVNDPRKVRKTDIAAGELPWFHRICSKFHVLNETKLPPGAVSGLGFETVTINAPKYVEWLYHECRKQHVNFEVKELESFEKIDPEVKYIINCTGLGALKLCNDQTVYPIRGQTVLVKNTTNIVDTYSRIGQDHISYLIPRPGDGGLIIGGCQQPGSWDYTVDQDLAKKMLHWAKTFYPDVFPADHDFEVIKHNVGLRPSRKNGVRLETETLRDRTIIHGYGIGGWGFQSSWGVGLNLVGQLQDAIATSESSEALPVYTRETALAKVKKAQNLWNTKNPVEVVKAYTAFSRWRNRDVFLHGHAEIQAFLTDKWNKEHNYRLRKELFTFSGNRIAVEFYYEYSETPSLDSQWSRCYGMEHWVFASDGRMQSRQMCGNEIKIAKEDRWFMDDDVDSISIPHGHTSF